jgi:hypothetical protein
MSAEQRRGLAAARPLPPHEEMVIEGLTDEEERIFVEAIFNEFGYDCGCDGGGWRRNATVPQCCGTVFFMEAAAVVERISALLDADTRETSNTSMRIPAPLRDAAALAVRELGVAPSATALTTAALRTTLEALVMQAVLDEHYRQYELARPDLGDLAVAAAEIDGHPLAAKPELLRQAATEISRRRPGASADEVVLWAEARAFDAA